MFIKKNILSIISIVMSCVSLMCCLFYVRANSIQESTVNSDLEVETSVHNSDEFEVVFLSSETKNNYSTVETWEQCRQRVLGNVKEEDAIALAKLTYGEAGGVPSLKEKAAVMWTALNHADFYNCSIYSAATNRSRFHGYKSGHPVTKELKSLAIDVLTRYFMEKEGRQSVGRVLPKTYLYFGGDGKHNYFREKYDVFKYWDWSLPNPYVT